MLRSWRHRRRASVTALALALVTTLAFAQRESGVRESRDGRQILVNKDVGEERWAIAYDHATGTVTGNVFFRDGSDPAYIWCGPTGTPGEIEPGAPDLSLSCFGSDPCEDAPCAGPAWSPIANVTLPVSFFLAEAADTTPTPSPTPSPEPTPGSTAPPSATPTPAPSATPAPTTESTATPTPSPTPSPSPSPSPTAGFSILGIPQANCRNGVVDAGEECDVGTGNFECSKDPEYQPICGPGSAMGWSCAYCAQTFTIGNPDFQPPICGSDSLLVEIQPLGEKVCQTIAQGPVASCSMSVGGDTANSLCLQITTLINPFGDPEALLESFRQTTCTSLACVSEDDLEGDCDGKDAGAPCTLQVDGTPAAGNCTLLSRSNPKFICIGSTVSRPN